VTLGQAIVMRCLLGIQIPPFDYLQIDGRKLSDFEYNVETLDHCPWGKAFQLMNSLKGSDPKIDKLRRMLQEYLVKRKWFNLEKNGFEGPMKDEEFNDDYKRYMFMLVKLDIIGVTIEFINVWTWIRECALKIISDIDTCLKAEEEEYIPPK
jgi:hypothetical protein